MSVAVMCDVWWCVGCDIGVVSDVGLGVGLGVDVGCRFGCGFGCGFW